MTKKYLWITTVLGVLLAATFAGCGDDDDNEVQDSGADTDTDTDVDMDSDNDTDSDSGSDSDSDSDTDTGTEADVPHWVAIAGNEKGLNILDTKTDVVYGPFLRRQIGTDGGGRFDIVVTPDGKTALVTNFGDSRVYFVDLTDVKSPKSAASLKMPMFAEDIAITADGKFALVTDGGFSPMIVSINVTNREIVQTVNLMDKYMNASEIAPDGTVVAVDYFSGKVYTLVLDSDGKLTYKNEYMYYINYKGEFGEDTDAVENAEMMRPVNLGIAPDGKTVLIADVQAYFDPIDDTDTSLGERKIFDVGVYQITAPGVLKFVKAVTELPRATQSIAFSAAGDRAYLHGNSGTVIDTDSDTDYDIADNEMDMVGVLNITGPGSVALNKGKKAYLTHYTSSQWFGVDTITVQNGKAYVTYPNSSYSESPSVNVVDLSTFKVKRIGVDEKPAGIAAIPVQTVDVPVTPGDDTCVGYCGGANKTAPCFCDTDCGRWNDCCADYETQCTSCDDGSCGANEECTNKDDGTYACGCEEGYEVDTDLVTCVDADECADETYICDTNATCSNLDPDYECICNPGFEENGSWGCDDIDECVVGIGSDTDTEFFPACEDTDYDCVNTFGDYYCVM